MYKIPAEQGLAVRNYPENHFLSFPRPLRRSFSPASTRLGEAGEASRRESRTWIPSFEGMPMRWDFQNFRINYDLRKCFSRSLRVMREKRIGMRFFALYFVNDF